MSDEDIEDEELFNTNFRPTWLIYNCVHPWESNFIVPQVPIKATVDFVVCRTYPNSALQWSEKYCGILLEMNWNILWNFNEKLVHCKGEYETFYMLWMVQFLYMHVFKIFCLNVCLWYLFFFISLLYEILNLWNLFMLLYCSKLLSVYHDRLGFIYLFQLLALFFFFFWSLTDFTIGDYSFSLGLDTCHSGSYLISDFSLHWMKMFDWNFICGLPLIVTDQALMYFWLNYAPWWTAGIGLCNACSIFTMLVLFKILMWKVFGTLLLSENKPSLKEHICWFSVWTICLKWTYPLLKINQSIV
jgi:hypothetical protein